MNQLPPPYRPSHYEPYPPHYGRFGIDPAFKARWRKRILILAGTVAVLGVIGIGVAGYVGYRIVTSEPARLLAGAAGDAVSIAAKEVSAEVAREKQAQAERLENPDAQTGGQEKSLTEQAMSAGIDLAVDAAKAEVGE